jgi:hypothetical protein
MVRWRWDSKISHGLTWLFGKNVPLTDWRKIFFNRLQYGVSSLSTVRFRRFSRFRCVLTVSNYDGQARTCRPSSQLAEPRQCGVSFRKSLAAYFCRHRSCVTAHPRPSARRCRGSLLLADTLPGSPISTDQVDVELVQRAFEKRLLSIVRGVERRPLAECRLVQYRTRNANQIPA